MSAELTVRQKILMAAVAMGSDTENFSVEDLIVRSWKMFPESFSLRGFERLYPDSNRVLAKLSATVLGTLASTARAPSRSPPMVV
jgi:hypothetical protein